MVDVKRVLEGINEDECVKLVSPCQPGFAIVDKDDEVKEHEGEICVFISTSEGAFPIPQDYFTEAIVVSKMELMIEAIFEMAL